ncbi:chaplin family protein [Actinomadura sp. 21ATH]|uniref:chaplin family protein n=1 Tax=Actinomadura sp. 21ATH TaxID=1735444 RepID=UPI0035BFC65C
MRTWARTTARTAALTAGFAALGATVIPATALAGPAPDPDPRYVDQRLAHLGSATSDLRVDAPASTTRPPGVPAPTARRDAADNDARPPLVPQGATSRKQRTGGAAARAGSCTDKRQGTPIEGCQEETPLLAGVLGPASPRLTSAAPGSRAGGPLPTTADQCGSAPLPAALGGGCEGDVPGGSTKGDQGRLSGGPSAAFGKQGDEPAPQRGGRCVDGPALPASLGGGECQEVDPRPVAAGGRRTSGTDGVASGNQVDAPVSAPVNVCGNAVAIFGTADAGCREGALVPGGNGRGVTSGEGGVVAGNQVGAPVSAPVNVCGNAVAIFGTAEAKCEGGASARGGTNGVTSGENGIIAGNQVEAPISAPVSICGNAVAIFGKAVASCAGGAAVREGAGQVTSGTSSVGGGNQVGAPVNAPADVCGNAVGTAFAGCEGGATVRDGGGQVTRGDSGALSGNQADRGSAAPLSACGNAAGIPHEAGAFCRGGAHVRGAHGTGGRRTSGVGGMVAGNQANGSSSAPSTACGNTGLVVGHGAAACEGGSTALYGTGPRTSGDNGIITGNQGDGAVRSPASACGNAGAVAGHPEPVCEDGATRPGDRNPPPPRRLTRDDLLTTLNAAGGPSMGNAEAPPPGLSRFPLTAADGRRLLITAVPGRGTPRPAPEVALDGPHGPGRAGPPHARDIPPASAGGLVDDGTGGATGALLGNLPAGRTQRTTGTPVPLPPFTGSPRRTGGTAAPQVGPGPAARADEGVLLSRRIADGTRSAGEIVGGRTFGGDGRDAVGGRVQGGWPVDAGPGEEARVAAYVPVGGGAGIARGAREGAAWALAIMVAVAGVVRRLW